MPNLGAQLDRRPLATAKAAGNNRAGSAALDSNGTVTISTAAVKAGDSIRCWYITAAGTVGGLLRADTADITPGVSFVIRSFQSQTAGAATAATTDTSVVGWEIVS